MIAFYYHSLSRSAAERLATLGRSEQLVPQVMRPRQERLTTFRIKVSEARNLERRGEKRGGRDQHQRQSHVRGLPKFKSHRSNQIAQIKTNLTDRNKLYCSKGAPSLPTLSVSGYSQFDRPGSAVQICQLWGGKGPGLTESVSPVQPLSWSWFRNTTCAAERGERERRERDNRLRALPARERERERATPNLKSSARGRL